MAAPLLSAEQIASGLAGLDGWRLEEGRLVRTFSFDSYLAGHDFARKAGEIAEAHDHHPDLLIGYRRVEVSTWTHDSGGITQKDVDLAKAISALA